MNTQQLDELNRVLKKIREIAEKSAEGNYIYRGEPDCYPKVSSTLYRAYGEEIETESFKIDVVQEEILEEARKYTREAASDLEILTELQHHGGKTNLIDFTADYLIALFFAADGSPDKDGRIILLKKESDSYQVEKPPKTINRVESQKSIFVQNSKGFVAPDDEVIIPKDSKQPMLNYLRKHHDISTETIYNDLHGFITNRSIHESAYTHFHKGLTCQNRGDSAKKREERQEWYEKAVAHYTGALKLKPDFAEAYNNRGIAYNRKVDFDKAIKDFTTAIELKPDYAEAYNNRGVAYGEKDDFDTAIQNYDKAIELKPDYAEAYNNRGVAYGEKDDFDTAIQNYDKAIEIKPRLAGAYYGRGIAYFEKRDFDKAIQNYDKAIEIKPDYAEAYSNRGVAHVEKRDFDKAIQNYDKAIEINPRLAEAYNNRGVAYVKKRDFDKAIQNYDKAIEIKPDSADAYCNRGEAWMHMSEWDKAKADLTVAKDRGVDIIASFQNDYENVADFEQKNGVQVPADIAEMLTRR